MTDVGRRGPVRSGLGSSLDVPVALLVATALLVLGLQGPTGSSIALPLAMASLALVIAVRRPRGAAWTWALAGSMAWTLEELAWSWTRTTGAALPAVGAVTLSDVLYLAGSVAWLVALLRLSHVRWPLWTLSALPPLVVLSVVLARVPGAGLALSFPLLDGLLILASLPALEGTLRGRASDARLLLTLGFFVRGFASANFAWLAGGTLSDGWTPYYALWLLGYLLIALGVWLELRQDERGPWPAVVVVVGLESVIFVTATSLFDAGMGATARVVTLATLGYVQLLGVLAVLVGDRRKRLKAESDLRHWSELLHHLGAGSPMATRIERPLEALWDEARGLLPDLQGLSAHGDPPVVLGRPEGYAFPLVREGAEVGHLHFARRPDGSEMLDALTPLFTQQVARMHEHAAWRVQAMTDALTGLHNRRGFELQLGRLLGRHADSGVPLAIAMLDLDHFKRINDVHGHPVGDRVLVLLARLLRDHVREGDVVVRWGGEEFLIVAAGLDVPLGAALLARLRQALRLATPTPLSRPLTFSAGLVVGDVPSEAATVFERIERADTALYAAKRAGRDRIEIASATRAERGEAPA